MNPYKLETEILNRLEEKYKYQYIQMTEKNALVDAILYNNNGYKNVPVCLAEIKSRLDDKYSYEKLKDMGVMVTFHKMEKGITLSKMMGIPFVIFYYFAKEDIMLSFRITDSLGTVITPYRVTSFETQRSNDYITDKVVRNNVLIDADKGKRLW